MERQDVEYWKDEAKKAFAARDEAKRELEQSRKPVTFPKEKRVIQEWLRFLRGTDPHLDATLDLLCCASLWTLSPTNQTISDEKLLVVQKFVQSSAKEFFLFGETFLVSGSSPKILPPNQCSVFYKNFITPEISTVRVNNAYARQLWGCTLDEMKVPVDIQYIASTRNSYSPESVFFEYLKKWWVRQKFCEVDAVLFDCLDCVHLEDRRLLNYIRSGMATLCSAGVYKTNADAFIREFLDFRARILPFVNACGISPTLDPESKSSEPAKLEAFTPVVFQFAWSDDACVKFFRKNYEQL